MAELGGSLIAMNLARYIVCDGERGADASTGTLP